MADQMLNVGVSLHVKPGDIDGSRDGHLRQIMTHQIDEHSVFRPFLFVSDHRFSIPSGLFCRFTLRTGALDGGRLEAFTIAYQQGFGRRTGEGKTEVVGFSIG